jgi:hypothetical protein
MKTQFMAKQTKADNSEAREAQRGHERDARSREVSVVFTMAVAALLGQRFVFRFWCEGEC